HAPAPGVDSPALLLSVLARVSAPPTNPSTALFRSLWTIGTLTTTTPQTLLILATVESPSALTNTASISHSDQFDANTGNNSASATETPHLSTPAPTKSRSTPSPSVGDTITFTLTFT